MKKILLLLSILISSVAFAQPVPGAVYVRNGNNYAAVSAAGAVASNIAQVAGATIAQGHGLAATAIRVELPTDGTGVVGLNAGSNIIGALTANQSVNVAQHAGVAAVTGSGTATGALRVELPTNGTGVVGLNAGSNVIGALTANQSVNIAQVAAATIATGHGTAAGSIRVELPTDGTGVVGIAAGSATVGSIASITTSVTPGTAAANLGKAEDVAVGSGDTLVGIAGQIQATPSATAGDNDYATVKLNAVGASWVENITAAGTPGYAEYAFGSVTGSYTTALTNSNPIKILDLFNATDKDLLISLNASTNFTLIKAGTGKIFDMKANGISFSSNVSVKNNGVAPTLGSLFVTVLG